MDKTSMKVFCENRLKNIMIKDKTDSPQKVDRILKAEILYVLRNYFELKEYDLDMDISINSDGYYHVKIDAECRNIKNVSYIS